MMIVSRLLKSWAMPPVSWPTTSSFCDWRSVSSVSRRSFASASSRPTKCCVERTISAASPIAEARQRPISPSTQVRNVRASAWRTASSLLSSANEHIEIRPDRIHHVPTDARLDDGSGLGGLPLTHQRDGAAQLGHHRLDLGLQGGQPGELRRVVGCQGHEPIQGSRHRALGPVERLEKFVVTGQQEPALARLGVQQLDEHDPGGPAHIHRVHDPALRPWRRGWPCTVRHRRRPAAGRS